MAVRRPVDGLRCGAASAEPSGDLGASAGANGASEPARNTPRFIAHTRAVLFVAWTFLLSLPGITVMLLTTPFVFALDGKRRRLHHLINKVWAQLCLAPFCSVRINGEERLPPSSEGCVYVANHQSIMDIFVLFLLGKPFKFVSKREIFYVPIIGLAMFLTGHISLKRTDARSQANVFKDCVGLLKSGVSLLVFPEGTRSKDGVVKSFKAGAFKMARRAGVRVVPLTLDGSRDVMPHGKGMLRFYPGRVRISVHAPTDLQADAGGDVAAWSDATRATIVAGME